MHHRLHPVSHRFVYRVFSMWLDLDEIPKLASHLRLFSHNRWNILSFQDRDHGPRDGRPLRPWLEATLWNAGIDIAGGPIRVLCFPRLFGYVFNPLSIWFCFHKNGTLKAILYEVGNTFGEWHGYLMPLTGKDPTSGVIRQSCDKVFHVSPFIDMAATYDFRLRVPDSALSILIEERYANGTLLIAAQSGRRAPLTGRNLLRILLAYPLMTVKVIIAIHWEALRLWRKGVPFYRQPPRPSIDVSVGRADAPAE